MHQICVQARSTERLEGVTLAGGAVNTVFAGRTEDQAELSGSSTGCVISASSSSACSRGP